MSKLPKHVFILHDPHGEYVADDLALKLGRTYQVRTLKGELLSGQPLNLKALIDNAFAVIIVNGRNLLHESLTSYAAVYAVPKAVFVTGGETRPGFALLASGTEILEHFSRETAPFWNRLKAKLDELQKASLLH